MIPCARCHRPLRNPPIDGMGPVCAAKARAEIPLVEPDLFGYDLDRAEEAARAQVETVVDAAARRARIAVRQAFLMARLRLSVAEVRP